MWGGVPSACPPDSPPPPGSAGVKCQAGPASTPGAAEFSWEYSHFFLVLTSRIPDVSRVFPMRLQRPQLGRAQAREPETPSCRSPTGVQGVQTLGLSATALPSTLARSWLGSGAAGTQTTPIWDCRHCEWRLIAPCHNASPHPVSPFLTPELPATRLPIEAATSTSGSGALANT